MALDYFRQINGLDVDQGLKNCMDDADLYASILEMYVNQLNDNIPELENLYNSQDWSAYGKTCHAIKGASASVGAVNIQSCAAGLETAGKDMNAGVIEQGHSAFCQQLRQAITDLSQTN